MNWTPWSASMKFQKKFLTEYFVPAKRRPPVQVKLNPAGRGDCLVPGISLLSLEPGPHYAYTSLLARTSTHLSTRSTSSWHTGLSVSWDEVQRVWRKGRVAETYIVHFRQFCPKFCLFYAKTDKTQKEHSFSLCQDLIFESGRIDNLSPPSVWQENWCVSRNLVFCPASDHPVQSLTWPGNLWYSSPNSDLHFPFHWPSTNLPMQWWFTYKRLNMFSNWSSLSLLRPFSLSELVLYFWYLGNVAQGCKSPLETPVRNIWVGAGTRTLMMIANLPSCIVSTLGKQAIMF